MAASWGAQFTGQYYEKYLVAEYVTQLLSSLHALLGNIQQENII